MKASSLDILKHVLEELEFVGYRRETTAEGANLDLVDRIYRPDGSLVLTVQCAYHPRTSAAASENRAERTAQDIELGLRDCLCADPENCTGPLLPGYRCKAGR